MKPLKFPTIALLATLLLACGCQNDEAGGGIDRTTKREYDRMAMKLEAMTAERDALRTQVKQLQDQLNATRTPATRP